MTPIAAAINSSTNFAEPDQQRQRQQQDSEQNFADLKWNFQQESRSQQEDQQEDAGAEVGAAGKHYKQEEQQADPGDPRLSSQQEEQQDPGDQEWHSEQRDLKWLLENQQLVVLEIPCAKCGSPWHTARMCSGGRRCHACYGLNVHYKCDAVMRTASATEWMVAAAAGDKEQAQVKHLLERLKREGHRPTRKCYMINISALVGRGKMREAELLVQQMKHEDGYTPTSILYNMLINGWCESGNMAESVRLLQQMEEDSSRICTPDLSIYNTMIKGYGIAGQPESALQVLQFLLKRSQESELTSERRLKPNLRTFNMVIQAFCKQRMIGQAWNVVRTMQSAGVQPDVITYNTIAAGYSIVGMGPRDVEGLIQDMKNVQIKPNNRTYAVLIRCYCRVGMMEEAIQVLHKMPFEGIAPGVVHYNLILKAFTRFRDWDGVRRIQQLMAGNGVKPSVITYSTIMNRWSSSGDTARVEEALVAMQQDPNVQVDVTVFAILAKAYARAGKPFEAECVVIQQMSLLGLSPNVIVYTTIMGAWCWAGRMDEALRVFHLMLENGEPPNSRTYETLIWGFCEARQPRKAELICAAMRDAGLAPRARYVEMISNTWIALGFFPTPPNQNTSRTTTTTIMNLPQQQSALSPVAPLISRPGLKRSRRIIKDLLLLKLSSSPRKLSLLGA